MVSPATVEQAEPQGSAAPVQDTSTPASGDAGAATPESFGSLYRQRVLERAARMGDRAGVSSAARETSAADEQPAPNSADVSRPGASDTSGDATAGLTRAQRKALKTGQEAAPTEAAAATDASASESDDPIVSRVASVERTVTEGLSRLEGLLKAPSPAEADPSLDGESKAYRARYGDDEEFDRRARIALSGSATGEYLDATESDELSRWALRREGRDEGRGQYQQAWSSLVLQAADAFGVPSETISRPGATLRDVFSAFVEHGATKHAPDLTAATEKISSLEAANRLLADENEALQQRLPASARAVLTGGTGASSRAAALADRSRMNGRQLMQAGLERQQNGRPQRPGAR